jgi:hypothetical protein
MKNKLSSLLAVSGLAIITTSTMTTMPQDGGLLEKKKKDLSYIEKINTQKRTVVDEWNAGCAQCKG